MIPIQQAVASAMTYAQTVLGPDRLTGLRLEEIESGATDGIPVWNITLSGLAEQTGDPFILYAGNREYKVFAVSKTTGEVLAMKIRVLASQ